MSKQLNRKVLMVNQRRGIVQHFNYMEPHVKSIANPSVVTWSNPGRGIEGESTNSASINDNQIINRNRRPM
jgi:hypothetical protein